MSKDSLLKEGTNNDDVDEYELTDDYGKQKS